MKNLFVVIRVNPFTTIKNFEALRMCVGMTTSDNSIKVVFIEDGVYALSSSSDTGVLNLPDADKHISTLKEMDFDIIAEKESLEERGIKDIKYDTLIKSRDEIADIITHGDIVINW
jgi:sulfur relay (sulfurtransferase) DsrF/TusC family protein